jgi:hypothetical protein
MPPQFVTRGADQVDQILAKAQDVCCIEGWFIVTWRGLSASRTKRASASKVSGSGALRRARLAAASRSRVASSRSHKAHQLIDLGDDAVLFGERWEGKGQDREVCVVDRRIRVDARGGDGRRSPRAGGGSDARAPAA